MYNISIAKYRNLRHMPTKDMILKLCKRSLVDNYKNVSISLIIVNNEDSQMYNKSYRDKDYPTNVISLEYPDTIQGFDSLMGEIILCDDIIVTEASEQDKNILAHYAHMIVHGMLHLQGYDHQNDDEANIMEAKEIEILAQLGYSTPYKD